MKNFTTVIVKKRGCYKCTMPLICSTPNGGDHNTCPLCGGDEFKYDLNYSKLCDEDDTIFENYCNACHIIFRVGCMHQEHGCTDSTYNGHLICEWTNTKTNEFFEGMPYFEDADDWLENVNYVKINRWCCPNKNNICTGQGMYPTHKWCDLCIKPTAEPTTKTNIEPVEEQIKE